MLATGIQLVLLRTRLWLCRVAGGYQLNYWDHSKLVFIPAKGVFCIGDIKYVPAGCWVHPCPASTQLPAPIDCLLLQLNLVACQEVVG